MEDQHTSNGGYDQEGVIWHQHSNRLLTKIMEFFDKETAVIDLGCGHNFYLSVLKYCGWKKVIGFDAVDLGSKYFKKADVTYPIIWNDQKYNVLSLEVGEHIPEEKERGYLDNLTRFGGDVIMSWAIEGQSGIGHINCRNNDWVIAEMLKRGYVISIDKTYQLRDVVKDCHCTWFKETLMYFTK